MSRSEVPMPQMGESIAEGTVSKWLRTVGHHIEKDEPILEISTDKVDAEIPSPVAGVIVEICVEEGRTVEVGTVLAYVETGDRQEEFSSTDHSPPPRSSLVDSTVKKSVINHNKTTATEGEGRSGSATEVERLRDKSSPVVRKIAEEHSISIGNVPGTGHLGRVTKTDILRFIKDAKIHSNHLVSENAISSLSDRGTASEGELDSNSEIEVWDTFYKKVEHPSFPIRLGDDVLPMDRLRQLTADHMVLAKRVVPHVHSVIEVDFSSVDRARVRISQREEFRGRRVSYTAFVTWACSRLLVKYRNINAVLSGKDIIHRASVNIGIAVDLNPGLIVPVIKDADEFSLIETSSKINDLAVRARSKELSPEEIQEPTFSITNPGILGTLVGMPIIPKGTSAILALGAVEKRPVVIENVEKGVDEIVVRKTSLFSLGFDHRIVDGADAARFLLELKELLEGFPEDA